MSEHDTNLIDEAKKAVVDLNKGFEEFKATNDERIKAIEGKGVDPLVEEKLAKIEADLDKAQKIADDAVLAVKRQSRVVTDEDGNQIDLDAKAFEWASGAAKVRQETVEAFTDDDMAGYKKAFWRMARKGDVVLSMDEAKALSVGSDPNGGYLVMPDTTGRIVDRVFETSDVRAYANNVVTGSDTYEGIYDTDEAAASWVHETESRAETGTPDLGVYRIPLHELQAMPKATQKMLDDSSWDVEAWLAAKVADKFARTENDAFVNGSGTGKPRGFLTYGDFASPGVYEKGAIEQFNSGANGAFVAAPNGGDVLFDAVYGLKAKYRANANWFMNRLTTKMVRKLKDSDGAYLWQAGISAGQPASLAGYSVAPFEDMPDPATGSLSLGFGDMREAYTVVDRLGIRMLRDPYSAKPHVLFYSTKRVGGDVVDFDALKLIKLAA